MCLEMGSKLFLLLFFISSWVCSVIASVSYDHKAITINGQRRILISGSIHYPRSTPEVCLMVLMSNVAHGFSCFLSLVSILSFSMLLVPNFYFVLCRCGLILSRRLKTEAWMLFKLMFFGMGMSLLLVK